MGSTRRAAVGADGRLLDAIGAGRGGEEMSGAKGRTALIVAAWALMDGTMFDSTSVGTGSEGGTGGGGGEATALTRGLDILKEVGTNSLAVARIMPMGFSTRGSAVAGASATTVSPLGRKPGGAALPPDPPTPEP
mmetsp:Transcript_12784/g.31212  ORF Transcript_12784/g.31212 Transcript_12784/m.31212 type:complete len:135 (+) Transcript_12784:778-1182(+)